MTFGNIHPVDQIYKTQKAVTKGNRAAEELGCEAKDCPGELATVGSIAAVGVAIGTLLPPFGPPIGGLIGGFVGLCVVIAYKVAKKHSHEHQN